MTHIEFEWDKAKSNTCLMQRGFDFAFALKIFTDVNKVTFTDKRWDYGEYRFQVIGKIAGRVHVVVFTHRNQVIRIISARKANLREVEIYENSANQS